MATGDKPLVWLRGEVKTPSFSAEARIEAGRLLRRVQRGDKIGLPASRPMPSIGPRCHELRIVDERRTWRLVYRVDADAVVIADVFPKTTQQTPHRIRNAGGDCSGTIKRRRTNGCAEAETTRGGWLAGRHRGGLSTAVS